MALLLLYNASQVGNFFVGFSIACQLLRAVPFVLLDFVPRVLLLRSNLLLGIFNFTVGTAFLHDVDGLATLLDIVGITQLSIGLSISGGSLLDVTHLIFLRFLFCRLLLVHFEEFTRGLAEKDQEQHSQNDRDNELGESDENIATDERANHGKRHHHIREAVVDRGRLLLLGVALVEVPEETGKRRDHDGETGNGNCLLQFEEEE